MSRRYLLISLVFAGNLFLNNAREIEIDSFEPHSDGDLNYIDYGTLRVAKKGRNLFVLLGDFKVNMNWGNEIIMTTVVHSIDHNVQMYKNSKGVCDFIKDENLFYADLEKQSNLPSQGTCPIPKGDYKINNYKIPIEKVPAAPPGKYIMKVTFSQDGRNIGGYTLKTSLKL